MTDVETVIAARDAAVAAVTTTAANVDLATQQADRAEVARDAAVAPTAAQIATVDADAGSAFRVQQDARLSTTYARLRLLDIRKYGAACDGTTNDVLAWRAAVADVATKRAAGEQVDGITWMGTTRIEVNGTGSEAGTDTSGSGTKFAVVIPSDVVVEGAGPFSTVKMTGVPATANGNPNQNSALGIENGTKNVEFRNFRVVGENGTSDGTGFTYLLNNQSAAIDILLTTSRDITVRNVTFENLYGFSVHDRGENTRISIRGCTTRYCSNGINLNSNYSVMQGCLVQHSEGFECSGRGITITDNVIEDFTGVGISAGGNFGTNAEREASIVANNTVIRGTGPGITINDAFTNGLIVGNTVRQTDGVGIQVSSTAGSHVNYGNIIANNNVSSCGLNGVTANNAVGISISGTGKHLVIGNRSVDAAVSGYTQQYGIRIVGTGVSGTRVIGNIFKGNTYDVEVSAATGVMLDDNNDYTTLSLASGGTLGTKTIASDQLHKGVETFNHHIIAAHPASGVSNYTVAAGAVSSAASRNSGTDAAGQVNYTVTTPAVGALFTMTFARAYATAPKVFVQATDVRAAAAGLYVSSSTTGGFTVSCTNSHAAGTQGLWFWVVGN